MMSGISAAAWHRLLRRPRRVSSTTDRGSAAVEAVLIVPVIVLLTLVIVQFALVWHGRHIAQAAAQSGVDAAAGFHVDNGAGQAAAQQYLTAVAPNLLAGGDIEVAGDGRLVTVTISAQVESIIPFAHFTVSASASGSRQQFVGAP